MPRAILGSATAVGVLVAASLLERAAAGAVPDADVRRQRGPGCDLQPRGPGHLRGRQARQGAQGGAEAVPMRVILALDNGRAMGDVLVRPSSGERIPQRVAGRRGNGGHDHRAAARFTVKPTKDRAALLKGIDTVAPDSSGRPLHRGDPVCRATPGRSRPMRHGAGDLGSTFSPRIHQQGTSRGRHRAAARAHAPPCMS